MRIIQSQNEGQRNQCSYPFHLFQHCHLCITFFGDLLDPPVVFRNPSVLPGQKGTVGATAKDNRPFVDAVLYRYRAGILTRPSFCTSSSERVYITALGCEIELGVESGVCAAMQAAYSLAPSADAPYCR